MQPRIFRRSQRLSFDFQMVQEQRKVSKLKIAKFLEYPPREQVYLELESTFRRKTNYTLHLRFASKLSNELDGFYLSSYSTPTGETRSVPLNCDYSLTIQMHRTDTWSESFHPT